MRQSKSIQLSIATPEAMRAVGAALGAELLQSDVEPVVIAIEGELGAGKTTLTAGVLAAMGVRGAVRSPTYTLVEPYAVAGRQVYHIDLYRLTDPRETEALGIRDLLSASAVLLIEWPSRGTGALPPADLAIDIQYAEGGGSSARALRLTTHSRSGDKLMEAVLAAKPELSALSP